MKHPPAVAPIWRALFVGAALTLLAIAPGAPPAAKAATLNSFVVSDPRCIESRVDSGACTISISGISAVGSDTTFQHIVVSINGKVRANLQGFFDTTGYLGASMMPNGLTVACGRPGSGGNPNYGSLYTVEVDANMFGNAPYVDTASVYCPYYDGKVFLPQVMH